MKKNPKILIVRLSAIGDVVHTLPILPCLRKKFPECELAWAVEDKASDLLVNNPLVDKVFIFPKTKWKKRGFALENVKEFLSLINEIRKERFDIAIDVQELFKSGLITFLSGAKRRIAHKGSREFAHLFVNEKLPAQTLFDSEKFIIERYLEPAKYLGADVNEIEFSLPARDDKIKQKINSLLSGIDDKEIVVFCPATMWASKHWREDYWAKLLDSLSERFNVIFSGAAGDNELISRITSMAKSAKYLNFAGKTSILELVELFNRAKYVIAPDTGPAHIANATQKPEIIMIFGSSGSKRTPPYGEKHSALEANLSCQPCFKTNCPKKDNFMECMKKITPEMVLKK
ncbi:MAG TPA: lipopolysaccharide heptosyltransferase II, partial [Candidatus Gastranaerophilales bacterium]|nr:lipopolysaccharide heptosyltransferase II [Candidatus Gastranaerophilales bacterium]